MAYIFSPHAVSPACMQIVLLTSFAMYIYVIFSFFKKGFSVLSLPRSHAYKGQYASHSFRYFESHYTVLKIILCFLLSVCMALEFSLSGSHFVNFGRYMLRSDRVYCLSACLLTVLPITICIQEKCNLHSSIDCILPASRCCWRELSGQHRKQ